MSLVYEEELQGRSPQVVAPQMDFSELRQGSLEVKPNSWGDTNMINIGEDLYMTVKQRHGYNLTVVHLLLSLPSRCCHHRSKYGAW